MCPMAPRRISQFWLSQGLTFGSEFGCADRQGQGQGQERVLALLSCFFDCADFARCCMCEPLPTSTERINVSYQRECLPVHVCAYFSQYTRPPNHPTWPPTLPPTSSTHRPPVRPSAHRPPTSPPDHPSRDTHPHTRQA